MNTQKKLFLLPYAFQMIGCVIAAVSAVVFFWGLFSSDKPFIQNDCVVFGYFFLCVGVFFIGLAREKVEDEFTLFMRTRSALTAIAIMFGLRILLTLLLSGSTLLASEETFNNPFLVRLWKSVKELTGFGGAFILYVILYKFRLARYNIRLASEVEEDNHQND